MILIIIFANYISFINFCNDFISNENQFALYPCSWREGEGPVKRTITNGICNLHTLPSQDAIKNMP